MRGDVYRSVLHPAALVCGNGGYTYYHQNPDPALGANSGDAAFFRFVSTHLPSPLPGLFMAGMLAAIMSTLSAGMNSMATGLAERDP